MELLKAYADLMVTGFKNYPAAVRSGVKTTLKTKSLNKGAIRFMKKYSTTPEVYRANQRFMFAVYDFCGRVLDMQELTDMQKKAYPMMQELVWGKPQS